MKKTEETLLQSHPAIAAEWNYNKNMGLRPEGFTYADVMKLWWICEKKHEWSANISTRIKGYGCPVCSTI